MVVLEASEAAGVAREPATLEPRVSSPPTSIRAGQVVWTAVARRRSDRPTPPGRRRPSRLWTQRNAHGGGEPVDEFRTARDAVLPPLPRSLEDFGDLSRRDVARGPAGVGDAAGYGQIGTVEEVSAEELGAQYETNVVGVVQVIQAVLPHMRERGNGHIINIGSMGGHVALPTMTVYTPSKSAVQNLTEGLAWELRPLGIDVTLVEPAGFNTGFAANSTMPATSIADYAGSYAQMAEFDRLAVRGDLVKSMAAVADITGTDEPPLHLAVATAGLEMVRGHFAQLLEEYARWEPVTAQTD
ncbi:SDR family NAD(P)-dependent oxidoreductase [Streptomyces sp. NPDC059766]|uniref:SDR family NAD(P)-dependent oxidoreductase n=1 Tax=Streptomyces sp. NPDC059766 TaxID=3346940 RepID=UPI0036468AB4